MKMPRFLILALAALSLAACSMEMVPPPVSEPVRPTTPPTQETAMPNPSATPDPDEPVTSPSTGGDPATPAPSPYRPQDGDDKLMRGPVFLDGASLLVMESFPPQIMLSLAGGLPTPCHRLRVAVSQPDAKNRIEVAVYSLVNADMMCAQVIAPLEAGVNLGSYPSGSYTVLVNGEEAGSFEMP